MHVYLIGAAGTGMGSLAVLFREAGHQVTGSDIRFDPPMGDVLKGAGVRCLEGFDTKHLEETIDLVVVGNVIRRDNVEAVQAERRKVPRASMSQALREHFLAKRRALVVCGTHGKTTTSSMAAWLLSQGDFAPGYFIGGVTKNFARPASIGANKRSLKQDGPSPFVVEGDEYDSVYWHKQPKFLDYVGASERDVVIVTSIEHDHIDIYPTAAAYEAAFEALAAKLPATALFVGDARDAGVRRVAAKTEARVVFYALEGDDTGDATVTWLGAPAPIDASGAQPFDLYAGGISCGRLAMKVPGAHNVRNAVGAMAACAEGFGLPIATARTALASFEGVRRRQDLLGVPGGVRVYDDFAHHPTAVDETLRALRAKHPEGALWAVFEPRSATACRALHQEAYATAFRCADYVLLAPLGRSNVPPAEQLNLPQLAADIGPKADASASLDAIIDRVARAAKRGDTVALLSNGAFGGLPARLLGALEAKG